MGLLVNGQWHDEWYHTQKNDGEFRREKSQFRHIITPQRADQPADPNIFEPEANRYHLYVSPACPWSHRTIIYRELKDLTEIVSMSAVHPHALERGWEFVPTHPNLRDPINYCHYLYEIYLLADPFYTGRTTIPVLWDKKRHTIVNNESHDIIRIFNTAFDGLTGNQNNYFPNDLQNEIEKLNQFIYSEVNNAVYRCGFATEQAAYDKAFDELFSALNTLEDRLSNQPYLFGNDITESDWRLFVTLIRFDCVYYGHFKCNLKRISDYPNLSRYLKQLYHHPKIAATVDVDAIKAHYYYSHRKINPTQIVPKGPLLDWPNKVP